MTTVALFEHNPNLQAVLKEHYPTTHKLLKYNTKGTLLYLKHKEAIKAFKSQHMVYVDTTGKDNLKTWKDYKKQVDRHLERINGDERLDIARAMVADKIKKEHYNKYPYWPKLGSEQTAAVDITTYGGYERDKEYIFYACEGTITVTDSYKKVKVENDKSFASWVYWIVTFGGDLKTKQYMTKISGNPVLKVVFIEILGLQAFEKMALENFEGVKKKVDNKSKEAEQKRIMFWKGINVSDDELE